MILYHKTPLQIGLVSTAIGVLFCSAGELGVVIGLTFIAVGCGLIAAAYTEC